jgi:secondary thiamine-phosphate synthase enzyme
MQTIKIKSSSREEMIDITREVERNLELIIENGELGKLPPRRRDAATPPRQGGELEKYKGASGVVVVFVQHTTCGMTVNENADPDVQTDMLGFLRRLIPQHTPEFKHGEQNSDAHIKASLVGSSVTIPFEDGRLALGRWQGVYLCEFDGPRERKVVVQVIGG